MQTKNNSPLSNTVSKLSLREMAVLLRRLFPYLRPYKLEMALLFVILPLSITMLVALPAFATKLAIDMAFPRKDFGLLAMLGVAAVGSMAGERFLGVFIRNMVCSLFRVRINMRLGRDYYRAMLRQDMRFQQAIPVGQKIFRSDTDIFDTCEMLGQSIPFTVQYIFQFTLMVITIALIDWRPLMIAIVFTPVFYLIGHYLFNFYRRVDLTHRITGQNLTTFLEQTYSAVPTIFSHGVRLKERIRYIRTVTKYSLANFLYFFMNEVAIVLVWPTGLPVLVISLGMGFCGYWVVTQELTLGQWQAMSTLIIQAIVPLGILNNYFQQIRLRMIAAQRVLSVIERDSELPEPVNPLPATRLRGEIELRDVHFAYTPDRPVLNGVSMRIPAGARVAIVGPSGIGKSTILNLLLRFYDPDKGQILVDGVDLREVDQRGYRSQVGIVLQEPVVFPVSIRENIAYTAHELSDERMREAARIALLDEAVEKLPEGYDTLLDEQSSLSLGEKQRIILARCIAAAPAIVLLDEPTAMLDPGAKQAVVDALDSATHGRTTIFVSHDLLTLRNMDLIFVLREGRVAESGSHDELLARAGLYHELWNLQTERLARGGEGLE